jgi:hypothetical protein
MNNEIKSIRRVLRELSDLAEHSSLTGSLSGGATQAVSRYNSMLSRVIELGAASGAVFQSLPSTAGYGELGVEARLLSAHLDEEDDAHCGHRKHGKADGGLMMRLAPFLDPEDLGALVREQISQHSSLGLEQLAQLAPFLDRTMLGELMRKEMQKKQPEPSPEPTPAPQPTPSPQPQAAPTNLPSAAEQPPKPEDLLALLKNPHLTENERSELIQKLTESVS